MTATDNHTLQQIVRHIDAQARLLRSWPLTGGVSAQTTALEIALADGTTRRLVMRQHGEGDRKRNSNVAADEFNLLQHLQSAGLPVPAPVHVDASGEVLPTPYIVIEFVDGAPVLDAPANLDDTLYQCAATLARIHSVDAVNLSFLPEQVTRVTRKLRDRPERLDESLAEGRIRAALAAMWPLEQTNAPALLHGDYWPGNLLFKDDQLAAVIDWEDAVLGDPLADLGNARLELLWAFGVDAMQRFTQMYQSLSPGVDYRNLPTWDLWAALRPAGQLGSWGLDVETERRMRERHGWFVAQALGSF